MPVQFVCPQCSQLLSVGSRKVGQSVNCPRCRQGVVVPTQEVAALSVAMRESSRAQPAAPPIPEFVVYDDPAPAAHGDATPTLDQGTASTATRGQEALSPDLSIDEASPPLIDLNRRSTSKTKRTSDANLRPVPPATKGSKATRRPWSLAGDGGAGPVLLVSRRMLYVQALLFAVLAAVFLAAGYFIGRGVAPELATAETPAGEPVVLQGTLQFTSAAGQPRGDVGALIVALPEGKLPSAKLSIEGLRLGDAPAAADLPARLALEALGGGLQRAAADGSYQLTLSTPGKFLVCFVSANTQRAEKSPPDEFQLALVNRYFATGEELIGRQKFAVKLENLPAGAAVRSHDFGQSGR